ncbi:hypothetical protein ABKA04_003854 [Annulohypoxylon sp. FPYF3050]
MADPIRAGEEDRVEVLSRLFQRGDEIKEQLEEAQRTDQGSSDGARDRVINLRHELVLFLDDLYQELEKLLREAVENQKELAEARKEMEEAEKKLAEVQKKSSKLSAEHKEKMVKVERELKQRNITHFTQLYKV